MGKKQTLEDRRKRAEDKGYNDAETGADDTPVSREVEECTTEKYHYVTDLWSEFTQKKQGASTLSLGSLKDFAKFMALSIKGINDPSGIATVSTTRNYFRCFVSGWNRDNITERISRDFGDSITNYIKTELKREIGLSEITRKKTFLTVENYMYLEDQLWRSDGYEYVHDGYRVLISGKLKCHVFTPARVGEISESTSRRGKGHGLRYKDTVLLVAWKGNEPELRYSLKREFAKGMGTHDKESQRPTHILYEYLPNQPLVVQPMLFMLAIFDAAGAFKKYRTIEEVLRVRPPPDQRYWVLEWADHILDCPVFPTMGSDGPSEAIQSSTSFSKQLKEISFRAGMMNHVTVHSGRRESLIQATSNGYSKDELMKFAAHTNPRTLERDYLSSITAVDGLGSFLKLPLRSDQAEDFRSMTVQRNPELLLALPAKERDELYQSDEWLAIGKELDELFRQISDIEADIKADIKADLEADIEADIAVIQSQTSTTETQLSSAIYQKRITLEKLKSNRNSRLEARRTLERAELQKRRRLQERIHPSEREDVFHVDQHRSRFNRLRHLMPERSELSDLLSCVAPLRSEQGISALKNLVALLVNPSQVAYQLPFRPVNGKCPGSNCGMQLDAIPIDKRWRHVFDCSNPSRHGHRKITEFCFICNEWVIGLEELDIHLQRHIDQHGIPLRCDFIRFRYAIACPGRCMTCMHNQLLPPSRRLRGFTKQVSWEKHVNDCYTVYAKHFEKMTAIPCPNPDCHTSHVSEGDSWYHLQDAHSYPSRSKGIKRERDNFIQEEGVRKRRKAKMQHKNSDDLLTLTWNNGSCISSTQCGPTLTGPEVTTKSSFLCNIE